MRLSKRQSALWNSTLLPAHRLKLGARVLVRAGLADLAAVAGRDLIGPDYQRARCIGDADRRRTRLGDRQPNGRGFRGFPVERRFVDVGRDYVEGNAQSFEQFAAITRTRRKDEARLI